MNKGIFNNFLNKFEDDKSRAMAKKELQRLTSREKERGKSQWAKKREEEEQRKRREEEERRRFEEERKQIEEEKLRREEDERKRREEEEKERKAMEEEEKRKTALARRKSVKNKRNQKSSAPKVLPKIIPPTASSMNQRLQESIDKTPQAKTTPEVGKLTINPFKTPEEPMSPTKAIHIPEMKRNPLTDIRKKFVSLESEEIRPHFNKRDKESNEDKDLVDKVNSASNEGINNEKKGRQPEAVSNQLLQREEGCLDPKCEYLRE